MRFLLFLLLVVSCRLAVAQTDSTNIPNSENGWVLSPHGMIRVLVLFAEIDYDKNPKNDPQPGGADHWPKGQLPTWKDDVFDAKPSSLPHAMVSRYYHDMSLGDYEVLGDYVDKLIVLKESEYKNLSNFSANAVAEANKLGVLHTAHNLRIEDFDLWKRGGKAGLPKINSPDDPHSYDHVMVILRNSTLTHGQGSTDPGSPGKLFGYESDSESRFGAMNGLPFEILKHEFNHQLLGGNNFHSGGGNASQFTSYFTCLQGGWSLMGAASSSLLTCSAWDRDRLGWRAKNARFRINARNAQGDPVSADLDPAKGDTGVFILRDFITSGDALRIRMPFLPEDEYPQWIWLENHQTYEHNGCPTDKFHYQTEMPCVRKAVPGIFAAMQVDREKRHGSDIYGGNADYLRAIPASGDFDVYLHGDTVTYQCLWPGRAPVHVVQDRWADPLAGSEDMELPLFDVNGDGRIHRGSEAIAPRVEIRNGKELDEGVFFGHARHAFTPGGVKRIGMGTNPSSANMLTLLNNGDKEMNKGHAPDNRTVYLNGISVELLEQRANGDIVVHVRANDTRIINDIRWCADSIVLPPLHGENGRALTLATGKKILIDRSRTPTRLTLQEETGVYRYFAPPTRFTISSGALVVLEKKSSLRLENGSVVHVMPGAQLLLDPSAKLILDPTSRIIVHGDARITASPRLLKKLTRKGQVVRVP